MLTKDLQNIVREAWWLDRNRDRQPPGSTHIGVVDNLDALVKGHVEFAGPDPFYTYSGNTNSKLGKAVERELKRLIDEQLG